MRAELVAYHNVATFAGNSSLKRGEFKKDVNGYRKYVVCTLSAIRRLFRIHHRLLDNPDADRGELAKAGERPWRTIVRSPPDAKAQNIAKRFLDNGDAYLCFIAHATIDPTNNRAEQAIRQVVIDRAASQGTRSHKGRTYKERMWTILATCAMRRVSAFRFIQNALAAHANKSCTSSLLAI